MADSKSKLSQYLKELFLRPRDYRTDLPPNQEFEFQNWVKQNDIPYVDEPRADYDMRGFYKALQNKDPRATSSYDFLDNRFHYPDIWKTPWHETFSQDSMYSLPTSPHWVKDKLINALGTTIFDARKAKK